VNLILILPRAANYRSHLNLQRNELVAESTSLPRESSLDSSLTLSVGGVPESVVEFDLAGDEDVEHRVAILRAVVLNQTNQNG